MKHYPSVFCTLLFLSFFAVADQAVSHKNDKDAELNRMYTPVTFSQQGINAFFTGTLNAPTYRQDILPNDMSHMVQFIGHGLKRRQGRAYTQSIMRMFNNVLKGSMYINAYAFADCLDQLTPLLHRQCVMQEVDPAEAMRKKVNDILYANFLNKFDLLKQDPDNFFDGISTDIAMISQDQQYLGGDISCQEFRKTLMTFFEHSLGKLVWDPKSGIDTWKSVKKIAKLIESLLDKKIITDEDDINDLCISLVERYCLFLDINAQLLPLDCYKEIKKEVLAQNLYFLELDEQEPFLEKKSQRILKVLLESEAKARATEYGIVVL